MSTISVSAKIPTARPATLDRTNANKPCAIESCEKLKHPEVGIALCEKHLQLAWAAYQIVQGSDTHEEPEPLHQRNVYSSDAQGYVYFARVGNLIKIGWSSDLRRRLTALKVDALLFSMPGTRDKEASIHALFKDHLDHGNEWFEYHEDILKYIEALRSARQLRSA